MKFVLSLDRSRLITEVAEVTLEADDEDHARDVFWDEFDETSGDLGWTVTDSRGGDISILSVERTRDMAG